MFGDPSLKDNGQGAALLTMMLIPSGIYWWLGDKHKAVMVPLGLLLWMRMS
jgi:hypothetical protein